MKNADRTDPGRWTGMGLGWAEMMANLARGIVAGLCLELAGCATITIGNTQQLALHSSPPGAIVTVDGRILGSTPTTVMLERDQPGALTFSLPGHRLATAPLTKRLNERFWWNFALLPFFPIGMLVDAASGAKNEFVTERVDVRLHATFDKDESMRPEAEAFIIRYFSEILRDLREGDGQTLQSLYDQLGVNSSLRPTATTLLAGLSLRYNQPVIFAQHAVRHLIDEGFAGVPSR